MNLKNNLISKQAQSSMEYLLLFAIIAALAFISVSRLLPRIRDGVCEDFFQESVRGISDETPPPI